MLTRMLANAAAFLVDDVSETNVDRLALEIASRQKAFPTTSAIQASE